jgi:hypothetical protein
LMPNDPRRAELVRTFKIAGCTYIAKSSMQAFGAIGTAEGSAASETAEIAVARAAWEAAEKALIAYSAGEAEVLAWLRRHPRHRGADRRGGPDA